MPLTNKHTHTCAPAGTCVRCGYMTSSDLCKACVLLEGLNKGQPKLAVGKKQHEVGWSVFLSLTCRINKLAPHFAFFFVLCVYVCLVGFSLFCFHFSFVLFVCRCTHEIRQGCVLQRTGMGQMATMMTMTASKTGRTTRARRAATSLPW